MFFELALIQIFVTFASFIYIWAIVLTVVTSPTFSLMTNHSFKATLFHCALGFRCVWTTNLKVVIDNLSQISVDVSKFCIWIILLRPLIETYFAHRLFGRYLIQTFILVVIDAVFAENRHAFGTTYRLDRHVVANHALKRLQKHLREARRVLRAIDPMLRYCSEFLFNTLMLLTRPNEVKITCIKLVLQAITTFAHVARVLVGVTLFTYLRSCRSTFITFRGFALSHRNSRRLKDR